MSNAIQTLGTAGPGIPLFAAGKEWYFSMVGASIRAEFSAWCRIHVQKQLQAMREEYSASEFQNQRRMLQDKILSGHYSWGTALEELEEQEGLPGGSTMGDGLSELWRSPEGQIAFTRLLLKQRHGEVSVKEIATIIADNREGFQDALHEALWLYPNLPTPEEAAQTALTTGKTRQQMWAIYREQKGTTPAISPMLTSSPSA